jgi:hypothetical protein
MILRNKRAETIFTIFIFGLGTFLPLPYWLSFVLLGLLARLSIKLSLASLTITFLYNDEPRTLLLYLLKTFSALGILLDLGLTVLILTFTFLVNFVLLRSLGVLIFRKIRRRIPGDIVN